MIPLRWIENNEENAKKVFGPGRKTPELTYLGARISADFNLSYKNLAPYVTEILDQAAILEGSGISVKLIEIKNDRVKVW